MDQRTAVERLTWRPDLYGNASPTSAAEAVYDGRTIAYITSCPLGWALRNYAIPAGQPRATEIYLTLDAAKKGFEVRITDSTSSRDVGHRWSSRSTCLAFIAPSGRSFTAANGDLRTAAVATRGYQVKSD